MGCPRHRRCLSRMCSMMRRCHAIGGRLALLCQAVKAVSLQLDLCGKGIRRVQG